MESKQALRRAAEARRREQPPPELDAVLAELVRGAARVAAYLPVGAEPRVTVRPGWLVPVVTSDGDLDWAAYDGTTVRRRGLLEPTGPLLGREALAACDLVLVPALLVDRTGARLGKGGGCYDRALPRATGLTVALVGDSEVVDALHVEEHDVRVAAVATPARGVRRVPLKMEAMGAFDDVLASNAQYAQTFVDSGMPGQAAKGLAVVTCMDSRIDPLAMLGLAKGDAKILRNAGGRVTDDVLRTLVLATHLLGVDRILVVEHTECKMASATDDEVHRTIYESSGIDTRSLEFRTMNDQLSSLAQDVQRVQSSPYLPSAVEVGGFVYDVRTGLLRQVT